MALRVMSDLFHDSPCLADSYHSDNAHLISSALCSNLDTHKTSHGKHYNPQCQLEIPVHLVASGDQGRTYELSRIDFFLN